MNRHVALILPLLAASPSFAASSQWQRSEGGSVRLVTSGLPDAEGRLRGALEINLKPGWKTYWRNPGASGIPPEIDLSRSPHVTAAEIRFPAPERVHDGETVWAGYKHSVRLPVTFTLDRADAVTLIDADVLLGICETICIPFQASFVFDPGADPDNQSDAFTVEMAHAGLPAPADDTFGITGLELQDGVLVVEAHLPAGANRPELFIDHEKPYLFGTPVLSSFDGGVAEFAVEIFASPGQALAESWLNYTLSSGGRAVEGKFQIR